MRDIKNLKKEDLKTGMLIKAKTGSVGMVMKGGEFEDCIVSDGNNENKKRYWQPLDTFEAGVLNGDIVAVYSQGDDKFNSNRASFEESEFTQIAKVFPTFECNFERLPSISLRAKGSALFHRMVQFIKFDPSTKYAEMIVTEVGMSEKHFKKGDIEKGVITLNFEKFEYLLIDYLL